MKIRHYIYIALTVLLAGCSEDDDTVSFAHSELMGRGVNFQTSIAEPFATRTTYRHDGSFNEGDLMTIYRQYSNDAGLTFDTSAASLTYRVYQYDTKYATGTDIALETDWKPKVGATGCTNSVTFTQTAADSLTWENGKTVRFRAWSRSNLAGTLTSGNKNSYYPDYCVSGWVTVSGPTLDVPMTLKHQGCRIGFIQKSGNVLYKAEICTQAADYMREDNSTTAAADEADKWAEAEAKAQAVADVYNKMCMPAGVDIETSLLKTMTKVKYNDANTDFKTIHAETDGIVTFGTQTAYDIANSVQRPVFTSNSDSRLYMVTIPYDMSNATTQGESLTLPAFTRFRIYIFDVNDGDRAQTDDYEATYHIFSLSDIKKSSTSDEPLFPDGLELLAGYSYLFTVGYHYDQLTITPADSFSWIDGTDENGAGADATQAEGTSDNYAWWKTAIKNAIPKTTSESYNPAFHISTPEQFLEFIKLVNGTAVVDSAKNGLLTQVLDPYKTYTTASPATKADYRWYPASYVSDGKVLNQHKADSLTHEEAEAQGFIFYEHYHPANADQAAYSIEDYLRGPYSFFDEDLNRHFMIYLDNDLDLYDWELNTIGGTYANGNTFRGLFDGQNHTISNIYMKDEYMFGDCYDVSIMNLNIETTHNFRLIRESKAANTTTGYGADFVAISLKAPSTGHPFADTVTGSSYMVGCFYEGQAGGAMIGTADNLYMYGNMVAATGLSFTKGALLGAYADSSNWFFAPLKKAVWGRFMVNYYDITLSPGVTAVGGIADAYYLPQQYIRGAESHILKAKNDNILADDVAYDLLTSDLMRRGYYGLAPWKAMNYAIYKYNSTTVGSVSPCNAHFVANTVGYDHQYPELKAGAPNSTSDDTGYKDNYNSLNVLKQNN